MMVTSLSRAVTHCPALRQYNKDRTLFITVCECNGLFFVQVNLNVEQSYITIIWESFTRNRGNMLGHVACVPTQSGLRTDLAAGLLASRSVQTQTALKRHSH
ncbi:unnamed protein product [Arctogadus glacialis]